MSKFSGDIWMDEKKAFFAALGSREQDRSELENPEIMKAMRDAGASATERGFVQNLDGAGSLLGGAVVLDSAGNILYEWQEARWGDKVPGDELVAACSKPASRL